MESKFETRMAHITEQYRSKFVVLRASVSSGPLLCLESLYTTVRFYTSYMCYTYGDMTYYYY